MKEIMTTKMLETDLWKPVSQFLITSGYTVRSEVRDCDITAIKDDILLVVELKKNLSVELLLQATKRQKVADLVYVAIPKPKKLVGNSKWKDICHLLKRLELGLLLVCFKEDTAMVEVVLDPLPFQREKSKNMNKKNRKAILKEISGRKADLNIGGSRGKKLVTAYREASIFICCCLSKFGELTPKKLRELGTDEKKTGSILLSNYYGWFHREGKGVYSLSPKGMEEIQLYGELVEYYKNII